MIQVESLRKQYGELVAVNDVSFIAEPGSIFGLLGLWLTIMGVLGIIAGVGLLARRPWARTMVIVFGCLSLLSFPFGTALGIYTLWVLASSESGRQYREAA